ncbi:MAG: ADOP family duplicated permease, partial [Gemmatirosa sp.]
MSLRRFPGVRRLFRLPGAERDVGAAVDEELAFHVDMLAAELVAAGRPPDQARDEALRRFGDLEALRARCHDISSHRDTAMRRHDHWSALGQDLRYAVRSIRRAPGFSAVVLLTLALGIGATTAMYSVVRGVLLRDLPFPQAERVVRLWPSNPAADVPKGEVSHTELADWERDLTRFTAVGAFRVLGNGMVFGEAGAEPTFARTAYVSKGFFPALGTTAALGRTLSAEEHVVGANQTVVVSHGFWERQLGADSGVVGRQIRLGGEAFTVVGVMPRAFAYPEADVAAWVPASLLGDDDVGAGRQARWLTPIARLEPGVTLEQGRQEVQAFQQRLAARFPDSNGGYVAAVAEPIRDTIVGPVRRGLLVMLGAVLLVLLVVCANVANLFLVRGTGRTREIALRGALGASRAQVVRLLVVESLLLSIVGGALGVLTAWWSVRTLLALSGDFLPRAADVRLDGGVLVFALGLSLLTGVVVGLWPALRASLTTRMAATLRESGRGSVGAGSSAHRARAALVAAEVALAVVLVVGAGLMLRSFQRLTTADPGFRAENALLARFSIQMDDSDPDRVAAQLRRTAIRRSIIDRVQQVPGVIAAGATKNAPLTQDPGELVPFTIPGRPTPPQGEEPRVLLMPATTGYLKALGVPLLAGEDVGATAGDSTTPAGAVVSRRMAEQFWPGRSAIGETFDYRGIPFRVVGIAGDVRSARLDSLAGFTAYVPDAAMPRSSMSLIARTSGDPALLAGPIRAAIREIVPGQAFLEVVPLRDKLSDAVSTPRLFTVLVTVFGTLALALAAIGLYGVVSYVVRQREREIAVRVALGAPPGRVMGLMLRQGMQPVAIGLALGLGGAFAMMRVLESLLFEVSASDPLTFVVVAALLATVALAASWLPSRRATRVAPAITLDTC